MSRRVSCAILAAGRSSRLGRPKQLLLYRGQPLIANVAECALRSRPAACAVVIGAHAGAMRAALGSIPIEVLHNSEFTLGLSSSIRVAVRWAAARGDDALLLTLCDQPKLSAAHLERLISEYQRRGLRTGSQYGGKVGVPAIFPRSSFAELEALQGDVGASALLNGGAPVGVVVWPDGEFDIDDAEAADRWCENPSREVRS